MYKKGTGNDKQGKDAGNRTPCPCRKFSGAINERILRKATFNVSLDLSTVYFVHVSGC